MNVIITYYNLELEIYNKMLFIISYYFVNYYIQDNTIEEMDKYIMIYSILFSLSFAARQIMVRGYFVRII